MIDDRAIATAFLLSLRSGSRPDQDLQHSIAHFPTIDMVRDELMLTDIPHIMRAGGTDPNDDGGVFFALLTPFAERAEVERYLVSQWTAADGFLRKNNILWPLLEVGDLPLKLHREAFVFVSTHFESFIQNCLGWWGPRDTFLPIVRKRIDCKDTPHTKYWVYLCVAMGSSDRAGLAGLLNEMTTSPWGINSVVAKTLLETLRHGPGNNGHKSHSVVKSI